MSPSSTIYLAGHRGTVGSAILRHLEARGHANVVVRTRAELDLLNGADVSSFFARVRPEYVFLAAARVGGIRANDTYRAEFIRQNLALQTNVIHAAYESGVRKLLFLGSSCIYPKFARQPIREEELLAGPLEPTNEPYAIAKIAGLKMCEAYRAQYGVNFISAMPTNLYGPFDRFDLRDSHVLPGVMRKFHLAKLLAGGDEGAIRDDFRRTDGREIPGDVAAHLAGFGVTADAVELWGTGEPRREFLHVDDCARALHHLMERYDDAMHINIGCGEDVTIRALAEIIREVVDFRGALRFNAVYPDGTPRKLLDVSRLRNLGWRPDIPLRDGIAATYAWYIGRSGRG